MDTPTPSKDISRRNHALHNEEVCRYIAEREEFGDWVITTAFYAALHWMNYKLFPLPFTDPDTGTEYHFRSLDEYRFEVFGNQKPSESKHHTLLRLAHTLCPPDIASEYRRLFEMCMTARYTNYRTAPAIIRVVQSALKTIHSYCDKAETSTGS
ncbi:MAG: hypothetical protein AB7H80_13870 [Candidatus Kapaibacterium sp.]